MNHVKLISYSSTFELPFHQYSHLWILISDLQKQYFTSCTTVFFQIILILLHSQLIINDYWNLLGSVKRKKKTLKQSFQQLKIPTEKHSLYCQSPHTFTTVYHEKCLLKIGMNSLLLSPRSTMSFSIIHSPHHLMYACKMVTTYSFHKLLWDLRIKTMYLINHIYAYNLQWYLKMHGRLDTHT